MESSRGGSIRIQHLTAAATSGSPAGGRSRFPKLDECAHFHYEQVELGPFQVYMYCCVMASYLSHEVKKNLNVKNHLHQNSVHDKADCRAVISQRIC
jgi:hypothetical protein